MPDYILGLKDMSFYAYHGFYEEEQKVGGWFNVNISLKLSFENDSDFKSLEKTVNYENIYSSIADVMAKPQQLIEGVAKDIYDAVLANNKGLKGVNVRVEKKNPPINMLGETRFEIKDF